MSDQPSDFTPDTIVLVHGLWMTPRSWENWVAALRGAGLPGAHPGLSRLRDRGRSAAREPGSHRRRRRSRTSSSTSAASSTSSTTRRSSWATRSAAPSPSSSSPAGSAARGVVVDSAPTEGVRVNPPVPGEVALPDPEEPRQPAQGGRLHARGVPLRVHQHPEQGGLERGPRALPHPGPGLVRVGLRPVRQPQARAPGDLARLHKADRAPLLFIAGGADHIMPASVNKSNAKKYKKSAALTEYPRVPRPLATGPAPSRAGKRSPTWRSRGQSCTPGTRRPRPEPDGPPPHPRRRARPC